ncbi:HNH endonuclease [Microbacterium sp. NPDC089190]|uniref:HNH endonuclease n=1 Tax=Microbacterium sp. NPDC089190 TaxID=3155063 RepID=UPI00344D2A2E
MTSSRTGLTPHLNFRRNVLARDKHNGITNCPDCGVTLDYDVSRQPNSAEPDHIIPIARGGTNATSNGRTICRRCNQRRGSKPIRTTETARPTGKVEASPIW